MRATILAAALSFALLLLVTVDRASSLPGLSARPSAVSAGLIEATRTRKYRTVASTAVPTTCPISARLPTNIVTEFYPPICYPL